MYNTYPIMYNNAVCLGSPDPLFVSFRVWAAASLREIWRLVPYRPPRMGPLSWTNCHISRDRLPDGSGGSGVRRMKGNRGASRGCIGDGWSHAWASGDLVGPVERHLADESYRSRHFARRC